MEKNFYVIFEILLVKKITELTPYAYPLLKLKQKPDHKCRHRGTAEGYD